MASLPALAALPNLNGDAFQPAEKIAMIIGTLKRSAVYKGPCQELTDRIARMTFLEAVDHVHQTVHSGNSLNSHVLRILVLAKTSSKEWEMQKEFFARIPARWKTSQMCAAVIVMAGEKGDFKAAQDTYAVAKEKLWLNEAVCSSYIGAASKAGHFAEAGEAFLAARKFRCIPCKVFRDFCTTARNAGRFEELIQIFRQTLQQRLADKWIYKVFMEQAKCIGRFDLVKEAFQDAQKQGLDDVLLTGIFIKTASCMGHFDQAKAVFDNTDERQRYCVEGLILLTYIRSAVWHKRFEEAKQALMEANQRGNKLMALVQKLHPNETDIFLLFMDLFFILGDKQSAKEIFDKARYAIPERIEPSGMTLDLRGWPRGAGILMVERFLQAHPDLAKFVLVLGSHHSFFSTPGDLIAQHFTDWKCANHKRGRKLLTRKVNRLQGSQEV